MITQSALRLSAQRALLGRIYPEMRIVKIQATGDTILLLVITDRDPSDQAREDISEAATEIIADFPEAARIEERFEVTSHPIAQEDVLAKGWVFQRAE